MKPCQRNIALQVRDNYDLDPELSGGLSYEMPDFSDVFLERCNGVREGYTSKVQHSKIITVKLRLNDSVGVFFPHGDMRLS